MRISYSCTDAAGAVVVISGTCIETEYGDHFDVMGSSYGHGHFSTYHKAKLGWYSPTNMRDALESGMCTLSLLERLSNDLQLVRIPREYDGQGNPTAFFYLEYRQPIGLDSSFPLPPYGANNYGVLIRLAPDFSTLRQTRLIDTTVNSPLNFTDAALPSGAIFDDQLSGIRVRTVRHNGQTAVVEISLPNTLSVYRQGAGSGLVLSSPSGIDCGVNCVQTYSTEKEVVLTAIPDAGSTFVGWSGGSCSGTGTCAVLVNAPIHITAIFEPVFTLSVIRDGTGAGQIVSAKGTPGIYCGNDCDEAYVAGTLVRLNTSPDDRSIFSEWSGVVGCQYQATCEIVMDGPKNLIATFTDLNYSP